MANDCHREKRTDPLYATHERNRRSGRDAAFLSESCGSLVLPWIRRLRRRNHGGEQGNSQSKRLRSRLAGNVATKQQVCEIIAETLDANSIVVERLPNDFVVVAGAPWRPTLQALDRVALDTCFRQATATGNGSNFSANSDWLFIPIYDGNEVVASAGLAGRYFRRRFDPRDAIIASVQVALRDIYLTSRS